MSKGVVPCIFRPVPRLSRNAADAKSTGTLDTALSACAL